MVVLHPAGTFSGRNSKSPPVSPLKLLIRLCVWRGIPDRSTFKRPSLSQLRSPCDWCHVSLFIVLIIMSIIWKQGHFWLQTLLCWPFTLHVSPVDPRLTHLPNCDLWFPQFIIQTMLNINWLLQYSPTPNNRWYTFFFLWRWEFGQPLRSLLDVTQKVQIQKTCRRQHVDRI